MLFTGNTLYKSRDFAGAIAAYEKAFSLNPDPVYLNNLAAVYLEQGEFDQCIKTCERAVDEGREKRVDYKVIAKFVQHTHILVQITSYI
jgi:stress-induced-phosphoprotein 1